MHFQKSVVDLGIRYKIQAMHSWYCSSYSEMSCYWVIINWKIEKIQKIIRFILFSISSLFSCQIIKKNLLFFSVIVICSTRYLTVCVWF